MHPNLIIISPPLLFCLQHVTLFSVALISVIIPLSAISHILITTVTSVLLVLCPAFLFITLVHIYLYACHILVECLV